MKKMGLIVIIMLVCIACYPQNVAINSTGSVANASAMLDVSANNKGILVPRMTTTERENIASPANGLLVFDQTTNTFWYFSTTWKEIPNTTNAGGGGGAAFALPYSGSASDPAKVFAITNGSGGAGSVALYGKNGDAGSGVNPSVSMGVWGDNSNGIGVVGTSTNGVGTYGLSFQNHGVSGYAVNNLFAGVYGTHANSGAGVLGDAGNGGIGLYGRTMGTNGKAGLFESASSTFADSVLVVKNAGFGLTGIFTNTNSTNGNAVVAAVSNAIGDGYYAEMNNTTNTPNAAFRGINNSLGGYGLYAESGLGMSARLFNSGVTNSSYTLDAKTNGTGAVGNFTISNASNSNYILQGSSTGVGGALNLSLSNAAATGTGINLSHTGTGNGLVVAAKKGKAGVFSNTDATNALTVLDVSNIGTSNVASFVTSNSANNSPAVSVNTNGTGHGLQSLISNASSGAAAIYGSSSGAKGVYGVAQSNGVIGQTTASTGGVGVLGIASVSSFDGIGVKGISNSSVNDRGAVTGINNSSGIGVYGSAGNSGYGIFGESGANNSLSTAAYFRNSNGANDKNVVMISNEGAGTDLHVRNWIASNTSPMIQLENQGTGKFLSLRDGVGTEKFSVSKSGNVNADGGVYVKGGYGIIRNSSGNQLRYELVQGTVQGSGGSLVQVGSHSYIDRSFNFSTPFPAPPAVSIGNPSNFLGPVWVMNLSVIEITTTGCTIRIWNTLDVNEDIKGTWNLMVIGME